MEEDDNAYKKEVDGIKQRYLARKKAEEEAKRAKKEAERKELLNLANTPISAIDPQETEEASKIMKQAYRLNADGTERLRNAVALAESANATGAQTMARLQEQSEQIGRIHDGVHNVNSNLGISEKIVKRMESFWTGLFTKEVEVPSNLQRPPSPPLFRFPWFSKKEEEKEGEKKGDGAGAAEADGPLGALGRKAKKKAGAKGEEDPRSKLFNGRKKGGGKAGEESEDSGSDEQEKLMTYLEKSQAESKEQDGHLDKLGRLVANMKAMGIQMNEELQKHTAKLEDVNFSAERTNGRVSAAADRVQKVGE